MFISSFMIPILFAKETYEKDSEREKKLRDSTNNTFFMKRQTEIGPPPKSATDK